MPNKPTNPLLSAIRGLGIRITCIRAYTTAYKAGGFRVKFYRTQQKLTARQLAAVRRVGGFGKVEQVSDVNNRFVRTTSLTIRAYPAEV